MASPSNESTLFQRSRAQTCDWRVRFIEFLYGALTIAWYPLGLVGKIILIGLTQFGKCFVPSSDDLCEDDGTHNVLLEPNSSEDDAQVSEEEQQSVHRSNVSLGDKFTRAQLPAVRCHAKHSKKTNE